MQQRDHRQLDLFGGHAHLHRAQLIHQAQLVRGMQNGEIKNGRCPAARRIADLAYNATVIYPVRGAR